MKKIIFLILLVIFISGCIPKSKDGVQDTFRCRSFPPGRGVVVDFINSAPPLEIREGKRFTVSLKFANHNKDSMNVQYYVQDSTDADGFEDQSGSVLVEGATVEGSRFFAPGCNLFGEDLAEKNLGIFTYGNLQFDETTYFTARINYDYTSLTGGNICVYNPALGSIEGCSEFETVSGDMLGYGSRYDPVTVTRVEKKLTGLGRDGVLINLDIFIENLGMGLINTEGGETVNFRISSQDGLSFSCNSENMAEGSRSGNNLRIYLDEKRAMVNCESEINTDRLTKYGFDIELDYPYEYYARTGPVKLIKKLNLNR